MSASETDVGSGRGVALAAAALVVAAALGSVGCAARPAAEAEAGSELRIAFDDNEMPEIFAIRATATPAADAAGDGLWAAVPGLPRPERGRVRNPKSGRSVDVALFRSDRPTAWLSAEAAARLGIGAEGALVEIVALRSQPRIEALPTAF